MGTDGTAIGRLKQLDGVRGLAACAVAFGYHSKILFERAVFEDGWGGPVAAWLRDNGWTAVDLFFLLSGFVFAHVYRFGESLQSTRALADFTVARIARLYPLHLFMLVCCAATFWWMPYNNVGTFIAHLFMLQVFTEPVARTFDGPSWSISVEVFCYILFAAAAFAGRRAVLTVACTAILASGIVLLFDGHAGQPLTSANSIARGGFGFFIGVLLWRYRGRFARVPALVLVAIAVAGLLIPTGTANPVLPLTALTWPAALILALRTRFMGTAPLVWLGDRSYSIYLVNIPVADVLLRVAGKFRDWDYGLLSAHILFVAIVMLLSEFTHRYIERPGQRMIRDRWKSRRGQQAAAAV